MALDLLLEVAPYLAIYILCGDMASETVIINNITGVTANPACFNWVAVLIKYQAFKYSFFWQTILQ